jgi:hypothetical protein
MSPRCESILCTKCGHAPTADIQAPHFPVPDIIHTRRIPTQSEASQVRGGFHQVRTDMSRLDDEIRQLQETTQERLRIRETLSEYMKEHEAALTPIERLAPEVLSEIFLHCLPPKSNHVLSDIKAPGTRNIILRLSRICCRWRKVALSTLGLYTSITLRGNQRGNLRGRGRGFNRGHHRGDRNPLALDVAVTKTWLSRSGTLPLSLNIAPVESTGHFHPAIDEALPHSDRWEEISLTYPFSSISNLNVIKGRLRCLDSLKFKLDGHFDTAARQPIDAFEIAPRLHSVEIKSRLSPHIFTLPWSQLTYLKAHVQNYLEDCLDVLSLCHNLRTCSLRWKFQLLVVRRPPIRMLHLHSLDIESSASSDDPFTYLSLPALRICNYVNFNNNVWNNLEFVSFLSRSQCSLQKLVLRVFNSVVSNEELTLCLEHSPDLIELELDTDHVFECPSSALDRLTNYSSDSGRVACLAPKLNQNSSLSNLYITPNLMMSPLRKW